MPETRLTLLPETSAECFAKSRQLTAEARALIDEGQSDEARLMLDQAGVLLGRALALQAHERMIERLEAARLQARDQPDTVGHMDMSHSLATSVGKGRGDAAFTEARKAAGLTMAEVAAKAKMGVSALKMARSGKRTIPRDKAERIAQILDWPATAQNWPGGIS